MISQSLEHNYVMWWCRGCSRDRCRNIAFSLGHCVLHRSCIHFYRARLSMHCIGQRHLNLKTQVALVVVLSTPLALEVDCRCLEGGGGGARRGLAQA